ncbi:MAG: hypothetical protein E6J43_09360 [Chloroflexi bacterium]|nr:MAG: hypothetical protein E6J43_09360 [Chloroflexota bacterium]
MEFEPGREAFQTHGRFRDYKPGLQGPATRPFTARLQLGGCDRCGGTLAWDELEERSDGGRGCYCCIACGARV